MALRIACANVLRWGGGNAFVAWLAGQSMITPCSSHEAHFAFCPFDVTCFVQRDVRGQDAKCACSGLLIYFLMPLPSMREECARRLRNAWIRGTQPTLDLQLEWSYPTDPQTHECVDKCFC